MAETKKVQDSSPEDFGFIPDEVVSEQSQLQSEDFGFVPDAEAPVEIDTPAPLISAGRDAAIGVTKGIANTFTPEIAKESYQYAKEGQSLFDPNIPAQYEKAVKESSKKFVEDLYKTYKKDLGESIGKIREEATQRGVKLPQAADILKDLEKNLQEVASTTALKEGDEKLVKGIIDKELNKYKEVVGQKQVVKGIKAPKFPIIEDPYVASQQKLQNMINQYQNLNELMGIETQVSPIIDTGTEYISKTKQVPVLKEQSTIKPDSLVFDKNTSEETIERLKTEYAQKQALKGNTVEFSDELIEVGNKKFLPVTTVSQSKVKNVEKVLKVPFPRGVSNPIEMLTENVPIKEFSKTLTPSEVGGSTGIINQLYESSQGMERPELQKLLKTYTDQLRSLDEGLAPNMSKLKEGYGQVIKVAEEIPGLGDYLKEKPTLAKGMEVPAAFEDFISKSVMGKEADKVDLTKFKSSNIRSGLSELEKMLIDAGLENPNFWKNIDDLDPIAKKYALSKVATGEIDSAKYAAPNIARGEFTVAGSKVPAKIGDIVGKGVGKVPKEARVAMKGLFKAGGKALPAIAPIMLYNEAKDAGLSDEEALKYSAALTNVDVAAIGAGAIGGPAGMAIGASLPVIREIANIASPELYKNKLELYRQLKNQGKSTDEALKQVQLEQAKETLQAPYKGIIQPIAKNIENTINTVESDSFLNELKNNPSYESYADRVEGLKNLDPEQKKKALFALEQEPAFRKIKNDILKKQLQETQKSVFSRR